jgi:arsenical pump membrane protein
VHLLVVSPSGWLTLFNIQPNLTHWLTWAIAAASVVGVIVRPKGTPEALWAGIGAMALVVFSLLPLSEALAAVLSGTDVYLFLTGMMLLAELAREEGLFDWLAAYAVRHAGGSASRLFLLVYGVGTLVTIFLSNDATAVVLTPAVYAAAKRAKAAPLPYLFACAFIANAASFVLPISNPANLVVFGDRMPALPAWLAQFGASAVASILLTYAALRVAQRAQLREPVRETIAPPALGKEGRIAAAAIAFTGIVLLICSGANLRLGLPTFLAGCCACLLISSIKRRAPWPLLRHISWSILPLVAGLFVLVRGVENTGALSAVTGFISAKASTAPLPTAFGTGILVALAGNLVNNLPMGLFAGAAGAGAHWPAAVKAAVLIGVDLGPNVSVTGSLATLLWLMAIRREGENVSGWRFLALGAIVMPPALLGSLALVVH